GGWLGGAHRQPRARRGTLRHRPWRLGPRPGVPDVGTGQPLRRGRVVHAHLGGCQPDANHPGQLVPHRRRAAREVVVDIRFEEIFTQPENEIFRVVFFPDRIYHARYLSATRSSRYRYHVTEVRSGADVSVIKGDVLLSGERLCGMLRVEYTGT